MSFSTCVIKCPHDKYAFDCDACRKKERDELRRKLAFVAPGEDTTTEFPQHIDISIAKDPLALARQMITDHKMIRTLEREKSPQKSDSDEGEYTFAGPSLSPMEKENQDLKDQKRRALVHIESLTQHLQAGGPKGDGSLADLHWLMEELSQAQKLLGGNALKKEEIRTALRKKRKSEVSQTPA